jgi:hypothetical protein
MYFGLEARFGIVLDPAIRGHYRIVRAKEHLAWLFWSVRGWRRFAAAALDVIGLEDSFFSDSGCVFCLT